MKILINGLTLKVGGARTVLVGTLKALARYAPEHDYVVYASARLDPPMPPLVGRFEVRRLPRLERSAAAVFLWEQCGLPRVVRREKVDAMYSICSCHGPRRPGCRQVMLVHSPTWFVSRREGLPGLPEPSAPLRRAVARLGVAGSEKVVFQTRAMAGRVRRFIPIPQEKVVISPQGVPEFQDAPGLEAERDALRERLAAFRRGHATAAVFVGYYAPYKNLEMLLDAAGRAGRTVPGFGLIVAGDRGAGRGAGRLVRSATSSPPGERVIFLGAVPDALMPLVYEAGDFLAFPSLLESYGLPMVEAMGFGLPVLAADTPVNREVCGEAAVYHAPFDADGLARGIVNLAGDSRLRRERAMKARERAKGFSWERHARALISALGG